jgi:hypothetical protein
VIQRLDVPRGRVAHPGDLAITTGSRVCSLTSPCIDSFNTATPRHQTPADDTSAPCGLTKSDEKSTFPTSTCVGPISGDSALQRQVPVEGMTRQPMAEVGFAPVELTDMPEMDEMDINSTHVDLAWRNPSTSSHPSSRPCCSMELRKGMPSAFTVTVRDLELCGLQLARCCLANCPSMS